MSTSTTTNNVIKHLTLLGHKAHRNHTTGIKGRTLADTSLGVGDILCCTNQGRWLEIEVKTGNDEQSEKQAKRMLAIRRMGGWYILVKTFDDYLEQAKQNNNWRIK